ncbi:MAG: nucleotide exchange factor GrpE [Verrucomicrobia bacterium]|nr:nucleotide exchange factor GrpE [Verrucomicrobiota bacterium]
MSKNKEKHNVHESAEKNHPSSADHAPAPNATSVPPAIPAPAEAADLPAMLRIAMQAGQVEKLAQLQDRLLRLQADFDNFRKRTLREKSELFDSANQALMLELLPVLDHLQLGIQAASAHQADPAFREGLTLIFDQLMGVLSKFGLSPIETENQAFDPNRFEAVNALPSATEPEGIVLALVRRGYMLRNKLLRPAQVIVSSGPPPEQNAECRMQNEECGSE